MRQLGRGINFPSPHRQQMTEIMLDLYYLDIDTILSYIYILLWKVAPDRSLVSRAYKVWDTQQRNGNKYKLCVVTSFTVSLNETSLSMYIPYYQCIKALLRSFAHWNMKQSNWLFLFLPLVCLCLSFPNLNWTLVLPLRKETAFSCWLHVLL